MVFRTTIHFISNLCPSLKAQCLCLKTATAPRELRWEAGGLHCSPPSAFTGPGQWVASDKLLLPTRDSISVNKNGTATSVSFFEIEGKMRLPSWESSTGQWGRGKRIGNGKDFLKEAAWSGPEIPTVPSCWTCWGPVCGIWDVRSSPVTETDKKWPWRRISGVWLLAQHW